MPSKIVTFLLGFFVSVAQNYHHQSTYKAAVVDYVHSFAANVTDMQNANAREFIEIMRNVSREYADIVVFPEYGLIDIGLVYDVVQDDPKKFFDFSTVVPKPSHKIAPCDYRNTQIYAKYLVSISCAARLHGLYTIINVLERRHTNVMEYLNTDVVFDRFGFVIAKYSKINLSEEPFLTPGKELVTFTTDFNVTFGIFTCFDILFRNPALTSLRNGEVTDVIFPTAWYSQTPFLQALSIEHGYAKTNGLNMLAACLQAPSRQDGGSGIYLADGTIGQSHVSASLRTKILTYDVPIVKKRTPPTACVSLNRPAKLIRHNPDGQSFPTTTEDMSGYVFKPLSGEETRKTVCSEDEKFCCHFEVVIEGGKKVDNTYRLAAFNGNRNFGSKILGGVRACVVLGCLTGNENTCGGRMNKTLNTVTFKSIVIQTTVDKTDDIYYQSSTLNYDLTVVPDYVYCEETVNYGRHVKITVATTDPLTGLLSFGIFGRVYSADKTSGETTNTVLVEEKVESQNVTLILVLIGSSVLGLITLGVLMWTFCTRRH